MSKAMYCDIDHCEIIREGSAFSIYDEEGDRIWSLMPYDDNWTDTQIRDAIALANQAFHKGLECGMHNKAREIRKALWIEE